MLDLILQTSVNAVYAASFMALIAVGLVMIFGVMGVINFAHGELYMMGAYAVVYFYMDQQLPFLLAVAIGVILLGIFGVLIERGLFRPMRDNPLGGLIVSIGLLLILQALAVLGFGVRMEFVNNPFPGAITLFGIEGLTIPIQRLILIVAAVVLLGALWLFLRRSKWGWALRACAQDPDAAALQGMSMDHAARLAIVIGAALAGVAGALSAPLVQPSPFMGHSVIVAAFIVIIVGGMGSLEGAVVASILYAFVHTFVTTFSSGVVADIVGLLLMLIVLTIKPTGLFGKADRA